MDGAADNVVPPCFVVGSVRLLRQDRNALVKAIPLIIGPVAPDYSESADCRDACLLVQWVRDGHPGSDLDPIVEIWNPGVIFQNGSSPIKVPKRYLEGLDNSDLLQPPTDKKIWI